MPPKRPGEQGPSPVPARKIRVVGISPKRHTGSIAPTAPQIADFSETLREVPAFNSMLIVVGDTPEAASDKLERVVGHQADAELREWNQAHYVWREVATKVFRMMGVHMTLLYAREQHADARKSLLQFLEPRQVDLGNIFGGVAGPSLYQALSELSKLGNEANTAIHSVTISQVLHTISVFNKYHTQHNTGLLPSPLRLPSHQCLGVLTTILKHILGVAVGEDLLQLYKDDSQNLGDLLDSYSTQTKFHELEPMQSVKIDWIPTWDEKHWGKVIAVAASRGLAVPQQKHQQELKEAESDVQRAKEAAEVSGKETIASKEKIRTLQSEVKTLKKRVKRLEGENEKLKAENEAIKAKNRNIEADYAAIKAENAAIKAENAAIRAENVALKKQIDDMQNSWKETTTLFMAQFALMQAQIDRQGGGNAPGA